MSIVLARQADREDLTEELVVEIDVIFLRALSHPFDVEWISVVEWLAAANADQPAGRGEAQ